MFLIGNIMTRDILLSQAFAGFFLARQADGYSKGALDQYKWGLNASPPI